MGGSGHDYTGVLKEMPEILLSEPAVRIKNLTFSFLDAISRAIDDVSLEIGGGEVVAITGPSGCGKSTLAMAIGGYIPHSIAGHMEGTVEVCGRSTINSSLLDIAMLVGVVQQDPEAQICTLSVEEEVAFGPENLALPDQEIRCRVNASLAMADASHLIDRNIHELSGGEKQRVAIASMLAMHPRILILDEPTSNLDPQAATDVFKAIRKLKEQEGMTIILIEHKLSRAVQIADRLIVMERGRVIMDGNPVMTAQRYTDHMATAMPHIPGLMRATGDSTGVENLRMENVDFSYGDREVLCGLSFVAGRGEIIGILGKNGSGKTTFLTQIIGLNKPGRGRVLLWGKDTRHLKVTEAARHVGYVFQNPNHQIFERTVRAEAGFVCQNFKFSTGDEHARISTLLDRYDLSCYAGQHPLRLSFGEKRRLNLCSVMPHDPDILLLDEPTIGQDMVNSARMTVDLLNLRNAGKTVIFVTHDADMAYRCCDRILFFEGGRIIVDDVPAAAFRKIACAGYSDYLPEGFV